MDFKEFLLLSFWRQFEAGMVKGWNFGDFFNKKTKCVWTKNLVELGKV